MHLSSPALVVLSALPALSTLVAPNALNLTITANRIHEIPSTLYGFIWEVRHIHSGDGGLYGELLQNRAFQGVIPGTQNALNAWQSYNGAQLSVTSQTNGVSSSLPNSLQVQIPKVIFGDIGFENTGYWGIKVQAGWTYKGSFYVKSSNFTGSLTVSLKSAQGTIYASKTLGGVSSEWQKLTFELRPDVSAPSDDNVFSVVFDGSKATSQTIFFGLFSLFPPTFRGRENGMRVDLAEAIAAARPSVGRFPGGSNLEGESFDTRWKWNETIGPLEERPGRIGDWGYPNTDGLGLLEYLNFAEDLDATCFGGIWSGISTSNFSDLATWPVVPEEDLQPFIDEALNEIEFIVGDAETSVWGQLRASLGRTEPYQLRLIELGNEDQVRKYAGYRWNLFVSNIEERYPGQFEFIATTYPSTELNPAYLKIDFHEYAYPSWFTTHAFMFDDYPRNGTKYFIGEYAVTSTNSSNVLGTISNGRLLYPTLRGSVAEAAFMTGLERNSDVVFASAYAPSLQHIKNYQWTPDILTFDSSRVVRSTSYYVGQMFSINRGTHVLETLPTSTNVTEPLFWVASYNNETEVVFLKVANAGDTDLVAHIYLDFSFAAFGTAIFISTPALSPISGQFDTANTIDEPDLIVPVASSFAIPELGRFNYTFPAMSVTVVSLQASDAL
ncbi:glycoside hydrolase [Desarmillaria ectypa]|nr:glycoside hydrolase [Desarmillaria ectypa]